MELNWDNAESWQESANFNKENNEPKWSWDYGFKLDFDGELVSIISRFYPPHKNTGDFWEGTLEVYLLEDVIMSKDFKCNDLDKLKKEVEEYTKHYKAIIKSKLS